MLIALDSNIFILALSGIKDHSSNAQKLILDIKSGKHLALSSSIVYGEVLGISKAEHDFDIEEFFSQIDNFSTIPADDNICVLAGKLRKDYGSKLKLPDAMHLATAIINNADLFITNDAILYKSAKGLISTKFLKEY